MTHFQMYGIAIAVGANIVGTSWNIFYIWTRRKLFRKMTDGHRQQAHMYVSRDARIMNLVRSMKTREMPRVKKDPADMYAIKAMEQRVQDIEDLVMEFYYGKPQNS